MENIKLERLDNYKQDDIIQYEKSLFVANKKNIEREPDLLEKVYNIDFGSQRLIPKIPYGENINIFVIRKSEQIIAAVCANSDMENPLFVKFGFANHYNKIGNCEGFGLFSHVSFLKDFGFPAEKLWEFASSEMIKREHQYNFSTTYGDRLLKGYKRMGYEVVDSIPYKEKNVYLIKCGLT